MLFRLFSSILFIDLFCFLSFFLISSFSIFIVHNVLTSFVISYKDDFIFKKL